MSAELSAPATRIRDLIGERHWLTDGGHKEHLLAEVLRRHVPGGFLVVRGFVVNPDVPDECSREQDILILDISAEAPLFLENGVAVASAATVAAAVSVKTKSGLKEIASVVEGLASVREVCFGANATQPLCVGYFFSEQDGLGDLVDRVFTRTSEIISTMPHGNLPRAPCDVFATMENWIVRVDKSGDREFQLSAFTSKGLSTGALLAIMVEELSHRRGQGRADFSELVRSVSFTNFPIPEPRRRITGKS